MYTEGSFVHHRNVGHGIELFVVGIDTHLNSFPVCNPAWLHVSETDCFLGGLMVVIY